MLVVFLKEAHEFLGTILMLKSIARFLLCICYLTAGHTFAQQQPISLAIKNFASRVANLSWNLSYAPVWDSMKSDCHAITSSTSNLATRSLGFCHLIAQIAAHVPFEGILRACCLSETFLKKYAGITELTTIANSNDPDLKEIASTMQIDQNKIWMAKIPHSTNLPGVKVAFSAQTWRKNIIWLEGRNLEIRQKDLDSIAEDKKQGFDNKPFEKSVKHLNQLDRITMAHELAHTKRNSANLHICYCLSAPLISTLCINIADLLTQKALSSSILVHKPLIQTLSTIAHKITTSPITQFIFQQFIQRSLQKHDELETDIQGAIDSNQIKVFQKSRQKEARLEKEQWEQSTVWGKLNIMTNRFFETHPTFEQTLKRLENLRS